MSVNKNLIGNNPIWTSGTTTVKMDFAAMGGVTTMSFDPSSMAGKSVTHVMLSNTGTVNIYVGTSAVAAHGLLLQPGGSLSVAVDTDAIITVNGAATAVFDLLLFP